MGSTSATKRACAGLLAVLMASLTAGCGRRPQTVTLAGSTSFLPVAVKLADRFMAAHPDVRISVHGGGSTAGIESVSSGVADIGVADQVTLPSAAQGLVCRVVARDGIAVIVHPSNPAASLTYQEIREVFDGTLRNWRDLGGLDAAIDVVVSETGSGTRAAFEELAGHPSLQANPVVVESAGAIRRTVASDPHAVGYLAHALVDDSVKPVAVDGVLCSLETIARGEYRFVRPYYLLTAGEPSGAVRQFIAYLASAEGQGIIAEEGLVSAAGGD